MLGLDHPRLNLENFPPNLNFFRSGQKSINELGQKNLALRRVSPLFIVGQKRAKVRMSQGLSLPVLVKLNFVSDFGHKEE